MEFFFFFLGTVDSSWSIQEKTLTEGVFRPSVAGIIIQEMEKNFGVATGYIQVSNMTAPISKDIKGLFRNQTLYRFF